MKVSLRTSLQEHPVDIRHIYDTHTQRTYKMATDDPAAPSQQQRPSQVRIHLHTNSEDIQLPQDTGPILVSTGKSGAGAASTACTLPFYPPASIHTDERVACPRPYSALWGSKLQSSCGKPKRLHCIEARELLAVSCTPVHACASTRARFGRWSGILRLGSPYAVVRRLPYS